MTRRARPPDPPRQPVSLRVSRTEAAEKIQTQINEGEGLGGQQPRNNQELEALREKYRLWSDYNRELLRTLFTTEEISDEYAAFYGAAYSMNPTFEERIGYVVNDIQTKLTRLRSIYRRLELFPQPIGVATAPQRPQGRLSSRIFLVHGHDETAKESVARFLQRLELEVVVLHEQPDQGRTIIEKFEAYSDVGFSVVLLTPDDIGAPRGSAGDLKPRARQNVILELGYFLGALGRTHVVALRVGDVEIPSDLSGVLYIPLDPAGAWKLRLAGELKSAGLPVDLNRSL